jgi:nucleoside-diphosphate-sugar epimerase
MARRRALVTGANGGIGSAVCDRLRGNGSRSEQWTQWNRATWWLT